MNHQTKIFIATLIFALSACSSGGSSDNSAASSTPQVNTSSSVSSEAIQSSLATTESSSSQASSSEASTNQTLALQQNLKARLETALASADPQTFLDLIYLEGVDAELIDTTRTVILPPILDESYESITFEAATGPYESFDPDYRYMPNLDVIGQVVLEVTPEANASSSFTFLYGLVDGEYRLTHSTRELMDYEGPRNTPISYSIFGQASSTPDQFHIIASYQVSGLTKEIDAIIPAGSSSTFYGQYFNTITLDQVVGNDEFHLIVSEDNTVIYTSETKSNGGSVSYVKN